MMAILEAGVISDQMYVEFLQGEIGKSGFSEFFRVLLEAPREVHFCGIAQTARTALALRQCCSLVY
jgi:hypothetical protein